MTDSTTPKEISGKNKKEVDVVNEPSPVTLDFIRKFARSFYVEKSLPSLISGLQLN